MNADYSTTSLCENQSGQTDDFAQARNLMVDDQLRPSEITDPQLLKVMRTLPREECVSVTQKTIAYADVNVPLGASRVLAQPLTIARLVQSCLTTNSSKNALIVGAATGYTAAIFAHLGAQVTALEADPDLAEIGQKFCRLHAPSVTWTVGRLDGGYPPNAPYDLIYFEGTISDIPDFCENQLNDDGSVVGMLTASSGMASGFQAYRDSNSSKIFTKTFLFDGFLPPLQGLPQTSPFKF